jgi:hypothetical protein
MYPGVPARIHLLQKRRLAIRHAQFLCARHEKTKECKVAWDYVEDITKAIHKLDERSEHAIRVIETPFNL